MIRHRTPFRLPAPCPACRGNRWRTVIKGEAWRCRVCGYLRQVLQTFR